MNDLIEKLRDAGETQWLTTADLMDAADAIALLRARVFELEQQLACEPVKEVTA
jgi:hypothetical protein